MWGYGIFKKQLVFRDKVVKQTMAYSTLFSVTLILYFAIILINEKMFKNIIGTESIMSNLGLGFNHRDHVFSAEERHPGFY